MPRIATSLDLASPVSGNPHRLAAYAHTSSKGSFVLGLGFTMDGERARHLIDEDSRNADVILPYLNGQDLNSSPDCSASRWIINFYDWPEEKARSYTDCYSQVYRLVRSERQEVKFSKHARESWWQYERQRNELYHAISKLEHVIAVAQTSSTQKPAIVPTKQVFDQKLVVFFSDDIGLFALLSSNINYWWIEKRGSTLKRDLVYIQSDVFETFAQPESTAKMRENGSGLDTYRRNVMLDRQLGLTATYNLVNDSKCKDADITKLREVHRDIDIAVVQAYGWDDLLARGLDHGFYETRQGPRYTIGAVVRQEILDRLLELNHERYAAEVKAGLHEKRGRRRAAPASDTTLF